MKDQAEAIVEQVISVFQRMRGLLSLMTLGSALLLSNGYLETLSFEKAYMTYLPFQIKEMKKKLKTMTGSDVQAHITLEARIHNAERAQVDGSRLQSFSVPLIGLTAPRNDANVILGIFLAGVALWILYSIHQVHDAMDEKCIRKRICEFAPLLRNSAVFIYPPSTTLFKKLMVQVMFMLPTLTMIVVSLEDFWTITEFFNAEKNPIFVDKMGTAIQARIIIETSVIVALGITTGSLIFNSQRLSKLLYPKRKKTPQDLVDLPTGADKP